MSAGCGVTERGPNSEGTAR